MSDASRACALIQPSNNASDTTGDFAQTRNMSATTQPTSWAAAPYWLRTFYQSPSGVHMAVRRGHLPRPMIRGRIRLFSWCEVTSMLSRRAGVGVVEGTDHDGHDEEHTECSQEQAQDCARSLATEYGQLRNPSARHQPGLRGRWKRVGGRSKEPASTRPKSASGCTHELTTPPEAQGARERLEAYVRSWLSTGLARGDWRETTARRYAESLDPACAAKLRAPVHRRADSSSDRTSTLRVGGQITLAQRSTVGCECFAPCSTTPLRTD